MPSSQEPLLFGKCAVVTGAGSVGPGIGNGRATAILLARVGATVALVDLNEDAANQTLNTVLSEGGAAKVFVGDVSNHDAANQIVKDVIRQYGAVDILVNNVGLPGPAGDAVEVSPESWHEVMNINVTSMMLMAKFCVPHMAKRGGGSIINMSSVAGLGGGFPTLLYPTTKGAIIAMTKAMAVHHGPQGIRVNCVAPGLVFTPLVEAAGLTDEMRKSRCLVAPLHIEGTGWDVAEAVVFLAGPGARWITGVVLPVDGGLSVVINIPTPAGTNVDLLKR